MSLLPRLARLSKDSLIYGLGGAAARYTGLLLLPIYTRVFSPGEYGVLESVLNLGALLIAIFALGLDGSAPLLYFDTESDAERRRICALWLAITVAVSVPATILLVLLAGWVSRLASGSESNAALFQIGIAVLPFSLLQVIWSSILRLRFLPRAYAVLNFVLTTLVAVLSIVFVLVFEMGLAGALWGQLVGTALVSLVGLWMVRDLFGVLPSREMQPHGRALATRLVRLGLPLVPASVALWIISFSNTYFLIQLMGSQETGVFRAGARLAALLGLAIWAFQLAWTPFSLSLAKDPEGPRIYSRVATLYTAGAVGASVLMSGFAPFLLWIFTTGEYAPASAVIGYLSLAASALGAYYVLAIGVNLAQRTGQIAWTTIVAAASNLALNALLIPVWGIVGAGISAFASNLISTGLVFWVAQRLYPLPFQTGRLVASWLAGTVCVATASVINWVTQPGVWMSVLIGAGLLVIYALVLFAARVITFREIDVLRKALAGVAARRGRGLL